MIRGELWWANFGIPFGSEPGYKRPVLIIQNDFFNNSGLNTSIVIPLTTNMILADAPGNMIITKKASKLSKDSVLVLSQIEVIDKSRFIEKISKVTKDIMEQVEDGMKLVLGLK
jgi:mRNA interferase MazF